MPPLPKRKLSRARRGNRRSHWALKPMRLEICPQCKGRKPSHQVCPSCGTYRGVQVIKIEEEE